MMTWKTSTFFEQGASWSHGIEIQVNQCSNRCHSNHGQTWTWRDLLTKINTSANRQFIFIYLIFQNMSVNSCISSEYREKIARNGRLVRLELCRLQNSVDSKVHSAFGSSASRVKSGTESRDSFLNMKIMNSSPNFKEGLQRFGNNSREAKKKVKFNEPLNSYMVRLKSFYN